MTRAIEPTLIAYAGIGSRAITPAETKKIHDLSSELAKLNFVVYSGNAEGSDVAFQRGSGGKCVLFLPWLSFNRQVFDPVAPGAALAHYDVGDTLLGRISVQRYHPRPTSLSQGAHRMMCRNYHQVAGYDAPGEARPPASFVVCCADSTPTGVAGGTGQAVRIAADLGVPIWNIRYQSLDEIWDGIMARVERGVEP